MQQGHLRHKQLSRARHEMAVHRRYMFAKKVNEGMSSFVNGVRKVMNRVADGINKSKTQTINEKSELKDIATDMFRNNAGIVKEKLL